MLGAETIEELSIALGLNLRHEQMMMYARLLEEYSKAPPRPRPQRKEEKGGGGAGGMGQSMVGVDLRLDVTLDHMLREVR